MQTLHKASERLLVHFMQARGPGENCLLTDLLAPFFFLLQVPLLVALQVALFASCAFIHCVGILSMLLFMLRESFPMNCIAFVFS